MSTKLIKLEDGTLIEIDVDENQVQQISGAMAEKVNATLDTIEPVLINACRPVVAAWKRLNKEM